MIIFDVLLFCIAAVIFVVNLCKNDAKKSLPWAFVTMYWGINALSKMINLIGV